mgnify:CR=1 FL=1
MRLNHISVDVIRYNDGYIFEGLKVVPQPPLASGRKAKPKLDWDWEQDDPDDPNTVLLLKNPAPASILNVGGYGVVAAFTGLERRSAAAAEAAKAKQAKQQAAQLRKAKITQITDENIGAIRGQSQYLSDKVSEIATLANPISIIHQLSKYPAVILQDGKPLTSRLPANTDNIINRIRSDAEEILSQLEDIKNSQGYDEQLVTSGGVVPDSIQRKFSQTAVRLFKQVFPDVSNLINQFNTVVNDTVHARGERARQEAASAQLTAQAATQIISAGQLRTNTEDAFRALGDYAIKHIDQTDIKNFIAKAADLVAQKVDNVGLIIPVPSRAGVNKFVDTFCTQLSIKTKGIYNPNVQIIKRGPFKFNKENYRTIIQDLISKAREGDNKRNLEAILNGLADETFRGYPPKYMGDWRAGADPSKTIGDIINKMENPNKLASMSAIDPVFRRAFEGAYQPTDVAKNALLEPISKNQKILVVDDNLYSGSTMLQTLNKLAEVANEITSELGEPPLQPGQLMGCVVVSPGNV